MVWVEVGTRQVRERYKSHREDRQLVRSIIPDNIGSTPRSSFENTYHLISKISHYFDIMTKAAAILAFAAVACAMPAQLLETRQTTSTCASGVHIIVARASTEAQGEGAIGAVAVEIEAAIPGSDSVAVVYPALLEPYPPSEEAGTAAMTALIQEYVASCPRTKIVLLGYSQVSHENPSIASLIPDFVCRALRLWLIPYVAQPRAASRPPLLLLRSMARTVSVL